MPNVAGPKCFKCRLYGHIATLEIIIKCLKFQQKYEVTNQKVKFQTL
jgi:hypothetical protein